VGGGVIRGAVGFTGVEIGMIGLGAIGVVTGFTVGDGTG
jgi:hypothetical protein